MNSESINSQKNKRMFNIRQNFIKWWDYHDIKDILLSISAYLVGISIFGLFCYFLWRLFPPLAIGLLIYQFGFFFPFIIITDHKRLKKDKIKKELKEKQEKEEKELKEKEIELQKERDKERELQKEKFKEFLISTSISSKEVALEAFRQTSLFSDYDEIMICYNNITPELKFDIDIVNECISSIFWTYQSKDMKDIRTYTNKFYESLPIEIKLDKSIFMEYAKKNCKRFNIITNCGFDNIMDFYYNCPSELKENSKHILLFLEYYLDGFNNGRRMYTYKENTEFSDYLLGKFNNLPFEMQIEAVNTIAVGLLRTAKIVKIVRHYETNYYICDNCNDKYCITNPETGCVGPGFETFEEERATYNPEYIFYFLSKINDEMLRKQIMEIIKEKADEELVSMLNIRAHGAS